MRGVNKYQKGKTTNPGVDGDEGSKSLPKNLETICVFPAPVFPRKVIPHSLHSASSAGPSFSSLGEREENLKRDFNRSLSHLNQDGIRLGKKSVCEKNNNSITQIRKMEMVIDVWMW